MIEVVNYSPEHLEKIVLKDLHEGERPLVIHQKACTFLVGNCPVAIFGGAFVSPGVFHLWGLVSENVFKVPKNFYKECLKMLNFLELEYHCRRIQIDIRSDWVGGPKWATSIGFRFEGTMRAFGPTGRDHHLYARVK